MDTTHFTDSVTMLTADRTRRGERGISRSDRMSIIEFDKNYKDLICDDAPKAEPKKTPIDPWDGEKPHAENGFVEKYCL